VSEIEQLEGERGKAQATQDKWDKQHRQITEEMAESCSGKLKGVCLKDTHAAPKPPGATAF